MDVASIQARVDAATKGPWQAIIDPFDDRVPAEAIGVATDDETFIFCESLSDGVEILRADAEFTAHARQGVPDLLAENARLRQVIAHLMTNPLGVTEATYWTSDIDAQTGLVDITDGPDDKTTITVARP